DDLAILPHGLPGRNCIEGELVPQTDRLPDLDRTVSQLEDRALRDWTRRHRHIIVVPQDDRPYPLERNGHHLSSLQPRTFDLGEAFSLPVGPAMRNGSQTNSPRSTVTARPMSMTRGPWTRTRTIPSRRERWWPASSSFPSFSPQYGPRQQWADPQTGS